MKCLSKCSTKPENPTNIPTDSFDFFLHVNLPGSAPI